MTYFDPHNNHFEPEKVSLNKVVIYYYLYFSVSLIVFCRHLIFLFLQTLVSFGFSLSLTFLSTNYPPTFIALPVSPCLSSFQVTLFSIHLFSLSKQLFLFSFQFNSPASFFVNFHAYQSFFVQNHSSLQFTYISFLFLFLALPNVHVFHFLPLIFIVFLS